MKIIMLTDDKYLYRKAELELLPEHTVVSDACEPDAQALIYDSDSGISLPNFPKRIIRLSRTGGDGSYTLPLPLGKLKSILSDNTDSPRLSLLGDEKCALLDGEKIKLTSHEYSLLELLISGGNNYVSRERISSEVWESAADGLINIYIHYLREKLESGGEKIILSSRKLGYKINEKYLGGQTV